METTLFQWKKWSNLTLSLPSAVLSFRWLSLSWLTNKKRIGLWTRCIVTTKKMAHLTPNSNMWEEPLVYPYDAYIIITYYYNLLSKNFRKWSKHLGIWWLFYRNVLTWTSLVIQNYLGGTFKESKWAIYGPLALPWLKPGSECAKCWEATIERWFFVTITLCGWVVWCSYEAPKICNSRYHQKWPNGYFI